MEYFFNPYQIAEMAMRVEEKGSEFYQKAAGLAANSAIKKIFLFLADAEVDHKNTFRKIMAAQEKTDSLDEYSIDVARNIGWLVEKLGKAIFDLNAFESSSLTIPQCLDIGIRVESGSIKAYSEIRKRFIEKFHAVLTKVIDQEKSHLEMLQNVKNKFKTRSEPSAPR